MRLYRTKETCVGCGSCADICPMGAIRMVPDQEGFLYPKINEKRCCHCHLCRKVCPTGKQPSCPHSKNVYLTARAKDNAVRYASSSGGIFPLLAACIFQKQGVVYGAAYDRNMQVVHREVLHEKELDSLKRTKYVQSSLTGVYQKVKKRLQEDRWVLFCGTPCQVHALLLFLGKTYPKLITLDLACCGVPSPGLWRSYVAYLEQKHGGRMTSFLFRDKRAKDNGHTCSFTIDGREYSGSLYGDPYCRMYFLNYSIRPSCHACRYCNVDRTSDFTVGDFWGKEEHIPGKEDKMGTSFVILHTDKAKNLWKLIEREVLSSPCRKKDILQPRLKIPAKAANMRSLFFRLYRALPFPAFTRCCNILFLLHDGVYHLQRLLFRPAQTVKGYRNRRRTCL